MPTSPLPCTLQVGFAGARDLIGTLHFSVPLVEIENSLRDKLIDILGPEGELRRELKLTNALFICGISQVAVGADSLFTEACGRLDLPQQIALPVQVEAYLTAVGSSGDAHFDPSQITHARSLLAKNHVISERIVADSPNQTVRFEQVNMHILRVSDVVIGLVRADQVSKRGGTISLLEAAQRQGRHVLQLTLDADANGLPVIHSSWHKAPSERIKGLPPILRDVNVTTTADAPHGLPHITAFIAAVRNGARSQAKDKRKFFDTSATTILKTHVIATAIATAVLVLHSVVPHSDGHHGTFLFSMQGLHFWFSWVLILMLGLELWLLFKGFGVHHNLEAQRIGVHWSSARSIAELSRSVQNTPPEMGLSLEHLFRMPFNSDLRPLLRTLNVLQLIAIKHQSAPWELSAKKRKYVVDRLTANKVTHPAQDPGQRHYFASDVVASEHRLSRSNRQFKIFTGLAIASVVIETTLLFMPGLLPAPVSGFFSFCAITFPVLAVAILSWASSRDFLARNETYSDTLQMIDTMIPRLENAQSDPEFDQLVRKVEVRLLTEVLEWQSRTRYKGVA